MKKVVSFCIFSMLMVLLGVSVKAQTPSGLTLVPANMNPVVVDAYDTVYLNPGACFDALGLADDDLVSIEWEAWKDGQIIPEGELSTYFNEFKFESRYNLGAAERWWGKTYVSEYCNNGNGQGSYPGAYTPIFDTLGRYCQETGHFCITLPGQNNPYEFDAFYAKFFKDSVNTAHRLIYNIKEDGAYQFVFHIYKRCNGTEWHQIYVGNDERYQIGRHQTDLCGLLSSDTLKPQPDTIPFETSICIGETYTIGGMTFDHDTTGALVPMYGVSSCGGSIDSVMNLTLHVIDPIAPTLDTNSSTLMVCDSGDVTLVGVPQNAGANGVCIWYDAMGNLIDTANSVTVHVTADSMFQAVSYNPEGGCTSIDTLKVYVEVATTPNPTVTADTTAQCVGGSFTITLDQAYDKFDWYHGNVLLDTITTVSFTINPAAAADSGIYYASVVDTTFHTLYNVYVACPANSDSVNLTVYEHATASITHFDGTAITTADQGVFCMSDTNHVVVATITGGTAPYVLTWQENPAYVTFNATKDTLTYTPAPTCDTIIYSNILNGGTDAHNCPIDTVDITHISFTLEDTDVPHIYMRSTDTTSTPALANDCSYLIPDVTPLIDSVVDNCGTVTYAQSIAAGTPVYVDTTLWIVATDNCGHKDSVEINIDLPVVHVSATDSVFQHVVCAGDANGIVDIIVKDGVRPYTVTITLGAITYTQTGGYTADTTFRFDGLVKGKWAVEVVDANGCEADVDSLDVSSPNILDLDTANVTNLTCWKNNSGSFDYQINGGSAPFELKIDGPSTLDTTINDDNVYHFTNLAAGTYTITVIDDHDCKDTIIVILTEPDSLQITTITVLNNVRCYGEANGQIIAEIAGGTADYVYTWKDSTDAVVLTHNRAELKDSTGRILTAGKYTLHVTDANNCPCVDTVATVTQHDTLQVVSIVTPTDLCPYAGTYDVVATVSGGTPNHTFTWTVNTVDTDIPSNTNLTDTYTYTEGTPVVCDTTFNISFRVEDDSACVATMDATPFRIVDNVAPSITGTLTDTIVDGCDRNATNVPAAYTTAAELIAAGLTLSDNCTTNTDELVITNTADTSDIACVDKKKAKIERTYSVTDKCGNASTVTHTIYIQDTVKPTFTVPADIIVYKDSTCNVDTTVAATGDVTDETDDCSTGLTATYVDTDVTPTGTCENESVIERTWSLVDECGNAAADQVQTITIRDTIHPWFTLAPKNDTSYCDDDNLDFVRNRFKAYPTYQDNCATVTMDVTLDHIDTLCNDKTTKEYYVFTLTDACGLVTTDTAYIHTLDTVGPRLTRPWFDVTLYDCADHDSLYQEWKYNINIIDDCNDTCWFTGYDSIRTPGCEFDITEVGKWYFTDGCNVDSATSTFDIIDQTSPYFVVSPEINVTVECDGHGNLDTLRNWIRRVQVADECSPTVTLNMYYEDAGGNLHSWDTSSVDAEGHMPGFLGDACSGYYKITWEAIDCSGNGSFTSVNPATTVEFFRITDSRGPVFDAPDVDTVDCANWEADYAAWLNVPDAFDSCRQTAYPVTNNSAGQIFYNGCYNTGRNIFGTVYISFSATDPCGKVTTHQSNFTVIDTTAPVVTFVNGTGLAPDTVYYGAGCTVNALIPSTTTWTIDTAGGNATAMADFLAAHADLGIADITDCAYPIGVITVKRVGVPELVSENSCYKTYRLPYVIKDHCGNAADTLFQNFVVGDTTTPKGNNISSGTINLTTACVLADALPVYTTIAELNAHGANITDCPSIDSLTVSAPVVTYGGSLLACDSVIISTYTITDRCGNALDVSDTIHVADVDAPVVTGPMPKDTVYMKADCSDVTIDTAARYADLADLSKYAAHGWTMTIEDCTTINITRGASVVTEADCPEKVIITTFTVDDGCAGNTSTFADTLVITDSVKPVVSAYTHVEDLDLNDDCTFTVPADVLAIATFADLYAYDANYDVTECRLDSNALVVLAADTTPDACVRYVNFHYKVQDLCGNVSDGQFDLQVKFTDRTKPAVTAPVTLVEDTIYMQVPDCYTTDPSTKYWTDLATAEAHGYSFSDCHLDATTFARKSSTGWNMYDCYAIDSVFYTVSDSCGNESDEFYQIIRLLDTTAPVITVNAIDTLEIDMDETTGDCIGAAVDTFFTYKDVTDYIAANGGTLTIEDCNVGETSPVTLVSADTTAVSCQRTVVRDYTISDTCGNTSHTTFQQVIHINDVTAPVLSFTMIADSVVYMSPYAGCELNAPAEYTTVSEFLAANPDSTITDCNLEDALVCVADTIYDAAGLAPYVIQIHRLYTVNDSCTHSTTFTHDIFVRDTLAPVVDMDYTDENDNPKVKDSTLLTSVFGCTPTLPTAWTTIDEITGYPGFNSITDCQLDSNVYQRTPFEDHSAGICPDTIIRHYYVKDSAGNETDFTQIFFIEDDEAPVVTGAFTVLDIYTDAACSYVTDSTNLPVYRNLTDLTGAGLTISDCHMTGIHATFTDVVAIDYTNCPIGTITRTYHITDTCGNTVDVDQTININDTIAPTLDASMPDSVESVHAGNCEFQVPDFTDTIANHIVDECGLTTSVLYTQTPAAGTVITDTTEVKVIYKDHCNNKDSVIVVVTIPAALTIDSVKMDSVSCHSMDDGIVYVWVSGGTTDYTDSLILSGVDTLLGVNTGYYEFTGLIAGNYDVKVVDADGCTANSTIEVKQPDTLVINLTIDNAVMCDNDTNHLTFDLTEFGTPNYTYTWQIIDLSTNDTTSIDSLTLTNVNFASFHTPGIYDLEASDYKFLVTVVDHRGCSDTASALLKVNPTYEFHDTARVCTATDFNWVNHRIIAATEYPIADSVYTFYDSLTVAATGCDSVWILHLTVTDKPYLLIRDRNNNADASTMSENDIYATEQTGNYAAGTKGYEIFVEKNCIPCSSNWMVDLNFTIFKLDTATNTYEEITSDVDDYLTPTYLTYMDPIALSPQTVTTAPVSVPTAFPALTAMHYDFEYFYLCWLDPDYACNPTLQFNSGIGYLYGRPTTIGFTQFRYPGEYKIQVDLRQMATGNYYVAQGYCPADGRIGGEHSTLTADPILESVNIYLTIEGNPLSTATPIVDPMEGVVVPAEVSIIPEAKVYPNPAHDYINVELSGFEGKTNIMLTNANGLTVENLDIDIDSDSTPIVKINTNEFAQGVYMVTARNNNVIVTKRVVIVK